MITMFTLQHSLGQHPIYLSKNELRCDNFESVYKAFDVSVSTSYKYAVRMFRGID